MIICITEAPHLETWESRWPYLTAKSEQKELELYQMDLLWLLAKRRYGNLPQPSKLADDRRTKDTRTAKQIKEDLLRKLGGGQ